MSTSRQGFGVMDCFRSGRMGSGKEYAFCSQVGLLLLLSLAICISGVVGSGHERQFQLRGRRLLGPPPLLVWTPPNAPEYAFPQPEKEAPPPLNSTSPSPPITTSPSPRKSISPPPSPSNSTSPPSNSTSPPSSPRSPAPSPRSPPPPSSQPPVLNPPPKLSPPPTAVPPSFPPLVSPGPSEIPPVHPPPPPTIVNPRSTWNESEKAGVGIAALAALLQVAVVAFLLIKRHQMLTAVEYEEPHEDFDNPDPAYRHPEDSA